MGTLYSGNNASVCVCIQLGMRMYHDVTTLPVLRDLGFCCKVAENCALLGYYAASDNPEERSSYFLSYFFICSSNILKCKSFTQVMCSNEFLI
jgi:hypothetical protein